MPPEWTKPELVNDWRDLWVFDPECPRDRIYFVRMTREQIEARYPNARRPDAH